MKILLAHGDRIDGKEIMIVEGKHIAAERLFEDSAHWIKVSAADHNAVEFFKRHYSFRKGRSRNHKNGNRVFGPGENITLWGCDNKSLFVWRKEKYRKDGQAGINCAVFRNEGGALSSKIINEAEEIAWKKWPGERLFTFVDPFRVASSNPGYCFIRAGWRHCGRTKTKSLIIFLNQPFFSI